MTQPDNNQQPQSPPPNVTTTGSSDVNTMSMLCHLLAFVGYIGIPFGNILGPLVMWLIKKDTSPEIDYHGKEALNFNISFAVYGIVSAVLTIILIGFILLLVILIAHIVLVIIASLAAKRGERYQYPLIFRLIK